MIKAVIFDLYETLITEFDPFREEKNDAAFPLGVDPAIFNAEWKRRKRKRMRGDFSSYQEAVSDILFSLGATATDEQLNALYETRVAEKTKPFMKIDDAVSKMLEQIETMGFKIGLISDCAPEEVAAWPESSLPPYFDDVIFSYQAGTAKPDAEIYLLACEGLAVDPSEAVFIGDGGSDELNGAFRAGLTPYQATWFLNAWPNATEKKANRFEKIAKPADVPTLLRTSSI